MEQRCFKQLSLRERGMISKLRSQHFSISDIARRIGRDKSTVSRELRRNAVEYEVDEEQLEMQMGDQRMRGLPINDLKAMRPLLPLRGTSWTAESAHEACRSRRIAANQRMRRKTLQTRAWVVEKLRQKWSPAQIAGRSKKHGPEAVSHEFVYSLIKADKKSGGGLYRGLKRFGRRKQRLSARDYVPKTSRANKRSIDDRPACVNERKRLGDCEGDLIVGYRQSGYVLSVIDRKSRKVILRKIKTKRKVSVRKQLEFAQRQLGAKTFTFDNGTEFFDYAQLEKNTNTKVYFTHPYCSTERASIENANGLVRYYLPKRTSFARLTQTRLNEIQRQLNTRPRKCLGYLTPDEAHRKNRRSSLRSSA